MAAPLALVTPQGGRTDACVPQPTQARNGSCPRTGSGSGSRGPIASVSPHAARIGLPRSALVPSSIASSRARSIGHRGARTDTRVMLVQRKIVYKASDRAMTRSRRDHTASTRSARPRSEHRPPWVKRVIDTGIDAEHPISRRRRRGLDATGIEARPDMHAQLCGSSRTRPRVVWATDPARRPRLRDSTAADCRSDEFILLSALDWRW